MIFETLHNSAQRDELMLVDGGMCHWHLRRDGQFAMRRKAMTNLLRAIWRIIDQYAPKRRRRDNAIKGSWYEYVMGINPPIQRRLDDHINARCILQPLEDEPPAAED